MYILKAIFQLCTFFDTPCILIILTSIFVFSLNYFPLEGVLAERLFAAFDKDKNNVIDYEEFLGEFLFSYHCTVHIREL